LEVKVATTDEERLSAYRVRYDVFCLGYGDNRYADHEVRVFTDDNDRKRTVLLIACDETHRVIGTARLTVRRDCAFLRERLYSFDRLAELVNCPLPVLLDTIALLDRGAVLPEWRGKAVLAELARSIEQIAVSASCRFGVSVTHIENRKAQNCLRWLGWTQYHVQEADGWTGIVWYKQFVPANS
jgi:GNAT superfamily N-acetyltransferase